MAKLEEVFQILKNKEEDEVIMYVFDDDHIENKDYYARVKMNSYSAKRLANTILKAIGEPYDSMES